MMIEDCFVSNPSFKKDFAFIRQLEAHNKSYQDKIWEKFVGSYNKNDEDVRIVNTRFESHPSGLSSESEKTIPPVGENWEEEASFKLSSVSLEMKSQKEKSKSTSGSKIVLSETQRKKLHKKLTKHIENGTLDKFAIENIGDHSPKYSPKKVKDNQKGRPGEAKMDEGDLERWIKSPISTSNSMSGSLSEISMEKEKTKSREIDLDRRKISEEIEDLNNQLQQNQKLGNKMKLRASARKAKSPGAKVCKKITIEVSAPTELRKTKYYIEKCIRVIKDISKILNHDVIQPDGSDEYARRQVRTKEFTSRFSRIYLYPLFTHMAKLNTTDKSSIYAKFTSMYQLTYQALQACFNHLPNTIGTSSYHKLRECLNCAIEICDKSQKLFVREANYDNEDYVCIFKSHCVDLTHKIQDNFLSISTNTLLNSKSTRTSLIPSSQNNRNVLICPENRNNLQKRFSMYNTNLAMKKDRQWKKMMAAFEEKKPKVKSRYRTATFKHRPPIEKFNSQILLDQKHRLDDKRSLVLLRNTPVVTPINEDHIQTMIQYENERTDVDENEIDALDEKDEHDAGRQNRTVFVEQNIENVTEETSKQEDILTKLLQLVQDNDQKSPEDIDSKLTNTIMVLQKCLSVKNQNTELLKRMGGGEDKLTLQNSKVEINTEIFDRNQKREPLVTVTGTKNAQLICITDDNSIASITNKNENDYSDVEKKVKSTEVQTSTSQVSGDEEVKLKKSRSSIKISRVKRQRRLLELLPKDYAINIIQYKLMFYKHHKGNYMYKKTSTTKPWELMDKISEGILDFALLGIAKEIEVNELLENIYNAEFQY